MTALAKAPVQGMMYETPTVEAASTHMENARRKAAIAFEFVVEQLAMRVANEVKAASGDGKLLTAPQLLAYGDYFYKVSGAQAKNAQQAPTGNAGFVLNINLGGEKTITIGKEEVFVLDSTTRAEGAVFTPSLDAVSEE